MFQEDNMTQERTGVYTDHGKPTTLLGPEIKVGQKAPDFALPAFDGSSVRLSDLAGKIRVISAVPSLDTRVCSSQTKQMEEMSNDFGPDVVFLTVSADLPFAQRRWAEEAEIKSVKILTDHHAMAFGDTYGTHVKEQRLEARSIFVIDRDGTVRYVEYVPEMATHPNYDGLYEAIQTLKGK
jgi:thiol peroxidase